MDVRTSATSFCWHHCKRSQEVGSELRVISLNAAHTARVHGVPAIEYFDLGSIPREIKEADLLVVGGGTIFQDRYPMVLADLYKYPSYSIVQFAEVRYLAKQFGVPVFLGRKGSALCRQQRAERSYGTFSPRQTMSASETRRHRRRLAHWTSTSRFNLPPIRYGRCL